LTFVCYLKRTSVLPKAQAYAGKHYCCVFKGRRRETRLSDFAVAGQNCLQEFLSLLTHIQYREINLRSKVDLTTLKNTTQTKLKRNDTFLVFTEYE